MVGATVLTTSSVDQLDETLCREFRMHVGAVMQVAITIDGKTMLRLSSLKENNKFLYSIRNVAFFRW